MALTSDQKKHLLIGSGIGAAAFFFGGLLFGGGRANAAGRFALPQQQGREPDHLARKRRHGDGDGDNDRGQYGRKKRKDHHRGD